MIHCTLPPVNRTEAEAAKPDAVNHPAHYTSGGIECIEAIEAAMSDEAYRGFLKGNVLKYLWRHEKKKAPLQDLEKARWYLDRLIAALKA